MKNFSEQKQNRIMSEWQATKCVIENPHVRHCERSATGTERSNLLAFEIATDSKCRRPRNDGQRKVMVMLC